jgi:hypothetical protein
LLSVQNKIDNIQDTSTFGIFAPLDPITDNPVDLLEYKPDEPNRSSIEFRKSLVALVPLTLRIARPILMTLKWLLTKAWN